MQQHYENDAPNSRFQFREEYWEQALALIEADEARRRKKRRWLWACCLAVLLLAATGYGIWETSDRKLAAKHTQQTDKTTAATSASRPQQGGDVQSARSNTIVFNGNTENVLDTIQTANPPAAKSNSSHNQGNLNLKSATKPAGNAIAFNLRATKPDVISKGNNAVEMQTRAESNQKALPNPDAGNTRQDQIKPDQGLEESESASNFEDTTPGTAQSPKSFSAPINALPLPLNSVQSQKTAAFNKPAAVESIAARQTKPIRDSRFTLDFAAAASAYTPAPDKRWLGFSAGAGATYKFSKSWSASAGLGLRFQPGNWQDSAGNIQTESLRYSFGFESLKTSRRALGLLSLEIPLSVAWHRGAIVAEAGMAPGRLLFALERYQETEASSLQAAKTTLNRLERSETGAYQKFYANAFAGLAWRCTAKASIYVKGNYRFGAILKATAEDPAIRGGSNVELGLKWAFGL